MKGKILILCMVFITLFGVLTRTFYMCLFIDFILFSVYALYKIFTRNNPRKKMSEYILAESVNNIKNSRKKYCFMLFCLLGFVLFFGIMSVSVSAYDTADMVDWDDYDVGSTDGIKDFYSWATTEGDDGDIVTYSLNSSEKSLCQKWDFVSDIPDTTVIDLDYFGDMTIHGLKFYTGYNDVRNTDVNSLVWNIIDFRLDNVIQLSIRSLYYYDSPYRTLAFQFLDSNDTWNTIYSRTESTAMDGKLCWFINYSMESIYGDIFNVKLYNEDLSVKHGEFNKTMAIWQGEFTYIDEIHITTDGYRNINAPEGDFYIGEIWFDQTGYVYIEGILANLYIKLYDLESGKLLNVYGKNFIGVLNSPYVKTRIYSDLWSGDYSPASDFGTTITISDLDLSWDGEWHYLNFTDAFGKDYVIDILGYTIYKDSSNYLKVYPEQTITIYLSDVVPDVSGYTNCKTSDNIANWGFFGSFCTDKKWYIQGESVNFKYIMPSSRELHSKWGVPSSHYYLWIYDVENLGWIFQMTDGGKSADNWDYISDYEISLDNNYHEEYWAYDPTETSGYKTVTGGVDEYMAYIGHGGGGLFGVDYVLLGRLQFFIESGIYTPYGNITSVSPDPPELGQKATISFDVNNNGYMSVRNLLAPTDNERKITTFMKFSGTGTVDYTFWEYGEYLIKLYVSSGLDYTSVDTKTISITTLNDTYGGFGYNVEFLTSEPARAIAGYDTVFVNYRSLSENGTILVTDSRGQQMMFSTFVGVKTGVLNLTLPNYAEIGEWNITLFGNDTLYSTFNVIAEENNWVEFNKNIFYLGEPFELKLKHDRKVEVVFYKDDMAYGQDWFLDVGLYPSGIFPVPIDKAKPEIGEWKVELWEVNNFTKIQKLAEDTCNVIERPEDVVIRPPLETTDLKNLLDLVPDFYKILAGILITIVITISPILLTSQIAQFSKVPVDFQVPAIAYPILAIGGTILCVTLGLYGIEITFFFLAICLIAGFLVYYTGNGGGNG